MVLNLSLDQPTSIIEHMFGTQAPDGLQAGEIREIGGWFDVAFDDLVHRLTEEALETGWQSFLAVMTPTISDRHRS